MRSSAIRRTSRCRSASGQTCTKRFASWFETKLADRASEYEEILGYHLEQAYRYGEELGVGASALASRAAEKLGSAGRRALDRGDVDGAGNLLSRAAAVLEEHDPIRIELQIDLGETLLREVASRTRRHCSQTPSTGRKVSAIPSSLHEH